MRMFQSKKETKVEVLYIIVMLSHNMGNSICLNDELGKVKAVFSYYSTIT